MTDGHTDHYTRRTTGHSNAFPAAGSGRHRAPADVYTAPADAFSAPLVPPDASWDPAEELAYLLRDARAEEFEAAPEYGQRAQQPPYEPYGPYNPYTPPSPPPAYPSSYTSYAPPAPAAPSVPSPRDEASVKTPHPGTPMGKLQEITVELPPLREVPRKHRKIRERKQLSAIGRIGRLIAALAAVVASMVSVFSGMVTYEPLRFVALTHTRSGFVSWWPLLVYGPWTVASLSVLRAALHRRRAVHAWSVVLLFSCVAVLMCVVQAPRTVIDTSAAALPGIASLACFQQLVRQITLTRPPRRATPRHRTRPTAQVPPSPSPSPSSPSPSASPSRKPAPAGKRS
ncbi:MULTISPECIES: DUF2637 domain-containing protein [unclassified Streptomyces]|uniref:DUF2637 domain-containing protein n=1 Tax=unclassified Streptomyces TaxID=2593676 RepID=UPI00068DC68E|nr:MULTISPECIES: DUF2637 domain-containing protein [unclassified Streptomyces]